MTMTNDNDDEEKFLVEFPDEYARIKREPDKRKIAIEKPQANWYTMKENTYIQLVGDKRGI